MEGLVMKLPTSLRWHYPDQVIRVLLSLNRRPESKLPGEYLIFRYKKPVYSYYASNHMTFIINKVHQG
ncbi:hypothetical protein M2263_000515 [Providencia alcalifaciens]|nr:hypothetical protein [Providencia alcalifaciens]